MSARAAKWVEASAVSARSTVSARASSFGARLLALALGCIVALTPRLLLADDRTAFLIERLKYPPAAGQPDDFRVRTNAALQLGRTNDDAAVQPLCDALGDPSDTVRLAVIAGLKRLGRAAAVPCLNDRLGVETSDAAKTQIQQAIAALGPAVPPAAGASGASVANAKFYVSLSSITNNTGRAQADVETIVLGAIRTKLGALGGYQMAPSGESPDAARAVMSSRHLKGYYLSVLVSAFDYSGGNLRVRVKVAVFSYPGKALLGEVPVSPVQSGVQPGDKASEDNLMGMAAGHAAELFAQSFQ
jgi:hypothetical protein